MSGWINLGDAAFCVVSGGRFRLDGGGMFGIIPRVLWQRHDPPDENNRIALETNCVVVRIGGKIVLIDTGNGQKMGDKERAIFALEKDQSLVRSLGEVGIAPEGVNLVILSHLHMDHAGGASELDEEGGSRVSFPNASFIVQLGEWDDAVANRSTMRVSYRPENLDPLEKSGRLELVTGNRTVTPGITLEVCPGHTRHLQMVHIQGSRGHAVFASDVLPTWSHLRLPYNMAYDMAPYENMLQKIRLMESASANDWYIVTSHDSRRRVGRLEQTGPQQWQLKEE